MANRYLSARDRDMRLDRSICLWEGKPVYVFCAGLADPEDVSIVPLHRAGGRGLVVKYTDDRFSYDAFRLGYINWNNNAYFLTRAPTRSQRQGLIFSQISSVPTLVDSTIMYTKEMEACILGIHPDLREAHRLIHEESWNSCAFSRTLALCSMDRRGRTFLQYRGRTIGWQPDPKEFKYLVFPSTDNPLLTRLLKQHEVPYEIK